jgi:general secretion pathway protein G
MTNGDAPMPKLKRRLHRGFTLIELVVVISIIGLLLSLAAPRYFASIERGKESVQQQNLYSVRDALDKFFGDTGRYPESLEELVSMRYLRSVPVDPFTERSDWVVLPPPDSTLGGVYDIKSAINREASSDANKPLP